MKKVLLFFSLMLAIAAQADVLGEYSFEGTLGDKIPVRLKFAVNGEEIAVGEIYYPKAKNPAPILVVGSPTNDEGWYYLKEYQSDGTITGTMLFLRDDNDEKYRMKEKEKMLAGEVYSAVDPELIEELMATREILYEYNSLLPSETQRMKEILKGLLGHVADDNFLINQPFRCDYGKQISIGKRFFANFNFTVLDEARVTIGDDCFIGPNVSIYTACHSTDPVERNSRQEWAKPVIIGHNVWIGGSVTILPGVTIGDNVTIGAGSVVVGDIPSNTVAVGNPCKVIKNL